jgi:hypothetical protein
MEITKYEFSVLERFGFSVEWLNIGVYFTHDKGHIFNEKQFQQFMISNRTPFVIRDVKPSPTLYVLSKSMGIEQYYNNLLSCKRPSNNLYLGLNTKDTDLWLINTDELLRYVDFFEDWVIFPLSCDYLGVVTDLRLKGRFLEKNSVGELINISFYLTQAQTKNPSISIITNELKTYIRQPKFYQLIHELSFCQQSREIQTLCNNLHDWFGSFFGEYINYIHGIDPNCNYSQLEVDMTDSLKLFALEYGKGRLPVTDITQSIFD